MFWEGQIQACLVDEYVIEILILFFANKVSIYKIYKRFFDYLFFILYVPFNFYLYLFKIQSMVEFDTSD